MVQLQAAFQGPRQSKERESGGFCEFAAKRLIDSVGKRKTLVGLNWYTAKLRQTKRRDIEYCVWRLDTLL